MVLNKCRFKNVNKGFFLSIYCIISYYYLLIITVLPFFVNTEIAIISKVISLGKRSNFTVVLFPTALECSIILRRTRDRETVLCCFGKRSAGHKLPGSLVLVSGFLFTHIVF